MTATEPPGSELPWPVRNLRDAIVVPRKLDRQGYIPFRFGGFDAEGAVLTEMRLVRHHRASLDPVLPLAVIETVEAPCVYGGFSQKHFGHFLIEGLARLWALRHLQDLAILWHGLPDVGWQRNLVSRVGLDSTRFVAIDRPLRIRSLLLPEAGFVIGRRCCPAQADALAVVPAAPLPEGAAGARLWLSRGGLRPPRKRIDREAEVEAILAAAGWLIFRPEAHPLDEQVAVLAQARVVAGIEGSAFHGLALVRGFEGRVVMLPRRRAGRHINPNHHLLFRAKGVHLHVLPGLLIGTGEGPRAPPLRFRDPATAAAAVIAAA